MPHVCSGCLATHLSPSIHVVVCEGRVHFVQKQSSLATPCLGDNVAGHRKPGLKYLLQERRGEGEGDSREGEGGRGDEGFMRACLHPTSTIGHTQQRWPNVSLKRPGLGHFTHEHRLERDTGTGHGGNADQRVVLGGSQ